MSDQRPVLRGPGGRFVPGTRGGPGNPHVGRLARLRAAVLDSATEQDVRDVIARLVADARNGNVAAAKVLLDRALGPATAPPEDPVLVEDLMRELIAFLDDRELRQVQDCLLAAARRAGRLGQDDEGRPLVLPKPAEGPPS